MIDIKTVTCEYYSDEFTEILERFLMQYKNDRSRTEVGRAVRNLCKYFQKDFLEITAEDIQTYFDDIAGKVTANTYFTRKSWFHRLAQYVEMGYPSLGYRDSYYLVNTEAVSQKIRSERIPTMEVIDRVLEASKENPMYYLIFSLAFRCALQATQIVSLQRKNIRIEEERAYFHFPKTLYAQEKLLVMPQDIRVLMLEYMENMPEYSDGYLFHNKHGNPLTIRNLDSAVAKYRKMSGTELYFTMNDLRSRSILEMIQASDKTPENLGKIAAYANLHSLRLSSYVNATSIVNDCPADLVNIRINPLGEDN